MQALQPSNLNILRHAFDRLNDGDIESCLAVMTSDFIINIAEMPYQMHGHNAWRRNVQVLLSAFPDANVQIEDAVSEGDKVAVRVRITGTHRGEHLGNAPTGKRINYQSQEIYRFRDGKIAEEWICSDTVTLLTQVGALSKGRLVSMWLAGYRSWFGFAAGVVVAAAVVATAV